MKRLLPGKVDVAILGTVAVLGAAVVGGSSKMDLGMAGLAIPIFFGASLLGMWKSGRLSRESGRSHDEVG